MKKIIIPKVKIDPSGFSNSEVVFMFQGFTAVSINEQPWPRWPYKPETSFGLGYNDQGFFLQFHVKEESIRALCTTNNGPVFEDSCVEFFIAPSKDIYFNFEFNCLGTCLAAAGYHRDDREFLSPEAMAMIKTWGTMGKKAISPKKGEFEWSLLIEIPFQVFGKYEKVLKASSHFMANFYKCGDKLHFPHYLSWTQIETPKPDFHQPDFFGEVAWG